jgi:demethylmenaquinone methyltransferase / 2-methoxy-6-polyprenyl-1,4-benzoquinol methylase
MADKIDFGFKKVAKDRKQKLVQNVFSSVASKYDIMNDFMSFGLHRLWKKTLINELSPSFNEILLDLAGGTGDIANGFLKAGGGSTVVADLNRKMLDVGKKNLPDARIEWVHANAEDLPFADNVFDYCTISFGIRNVTDIDKALREAHRVLKYTGKFVCLEFSNVTNASLAKLYDRYSLNIIPYIGEKITGDREAYRYLVESIRKFPKATQFANMMKNAGFKNVEFIKLTCGIVALHIGYF